MFSTSVRKRRRLMRVEEQPSKTKRERTTPHSERRRSMQVKGSLAKKRGMPKMHGERKKLMHVEEHPDRIKHSMNETHNKGQTDKIYPRKRGKKTTHDDALLGRA
jgi:hypothetical protein